MKGQATAGVAEPTIPQRGVNYVSAPYFGHLHSLMRELLAANRSRKKAMLRLEEFAKEDPETRDTLEERRELGRALRAARSRLRHVNRHAYKARMQGQTKRQIKKQLQAEHIRQDIASYEVRLSEIGGTSTEYEQLKQEVHLCKLDYYSLRNEVFDKFEQALDGDLSYKAELMLKAGVPDSYGIADVQFYVVPQPHVEAHLHYGGEGSPGGKNDGHRHIRLLNDGTHTLLYAREPARYS